MKSVTRSEFIFSNAYQSKACALIGSDLPQYIMALMACHYAWFGVLEFVALYYKLVKFYETDKYCFQNNIKSLYMQFTYSEKY